MFKLMFVSKKMFVFCPFQAVSSLSTKSTFTFNSLYRIRQQHQHKKTQAMSSNNNAKPAVEMVTCPKCNNQFKGEKGLNIHQSTSRICPSSAKYSEEAAKDAAADKDKPADTPCPNCKKLFKGERGVKTHLARSGCGKEKKTVEKKTTEKKTTEKKATEKKTTEKKTVEKKEQVPLVPCPKCGKEFKGEKGLNIHQSTSRICPSSAKYSEEAAKDAAADKDKPADTPCPNCKKLFKGERGVKTHLARSGCGKEKKAVEKKSETVVCDGCKGKYKGERGLNIHQSTSSICPSSAKYDAEKAAAAQKKVRSNTAALDTKCPHCDSMHKGQAGLAIHLAKNTKCPGSAKYEKPE